MREFGQNITLLYLLKIERSLVAVGLDAARGEVLHHRRPQQRATFSLLCGSKRKMHNDDQGPRIKPIKAS